MLYKKPVPKKFTNFRRKYYLSTTGEARACKRESGTGVLLWILWNFSKELYAEQLKTAASGPLEAFWEINILEIEIWS